jgi:hypothetical protein
MEALKSLSLRSARTLVPAVTVLALAGGTAAAAAPATTDHQAASAMSRGSGQPASAAFTWHPLTLLDGWQSASAKLLVTGKPAWALHNGVIYFRGAIKQPATGNAKFAKLPKFARPTHNLYMQVYTNSDVPGIFYVGADGTLEAYDGNAVLFTSLAAVSYPTSAIKPHKLTLKNGWTSSQPDYGTGDPSYAVSKGVVYLSGSLHGGSNPLAATLPKAARPDRELFISIYTFDGATGYLDIMPDGEVGVFGPDAGAYTSLANISYPVAGTRWHKFTLEDGWTPIPASLTGHPAYTVINGVVYFTGGMHETKDKVGLWTSMPKGVRTAADVLEIEAYTTNGTAGAIAVTNLFGLVSSMPFSNARQFTSLAGIAYPQSS